MANLPRGRWALVVAHPDDESMWFGGLLLTHPGNWTVICCSIPRIDPVRAWKFFDACASLNATPRLIPFPEPEPSQDLHQIMLDLLDLHQFDLVVTHNEVGEYGHRHHRNVHHRVVDTFPGPILCSGIGMDPGIRATRNGFEIELSPGMMAVKRRVIGRYNHYAPYGGIGRPVTKAEALIHRYEDLEDIDLAVEPYYWHRKPIE